LGLLLFRTPLHLHGQQFPSSPHGIFPSTLAPRLSGSDGLSLQRRSAAIEHEDRFDAKEEELANAAEKADDMTVPQGVAFLVANGFEELVNPDGGIDGQAFTVQCLYFDGSRAWLQDLP
jgi:hypothetical protein